VGAALTYARRYALFTLVGIAGEDDTDAPDLAAVAPANTLGASGRSTNGNPQMRTTFALPSFARSGARSATNSPSRSAVLIIDRWSRTAT
jgi:hypothetical protein